MLDFNNLPAKDKLYYLDTESGQAIYCCDNREVLPLFPDKAFDLVLTDPPYGVGIDYESYDDSVDNLTELLTTILPIVRLKGKRVLLSCGVSNMWLYPKPDYVIAWNIPSAVTCGKWGFISWSPILAYGKDPYLELGLGSRPTLITMTETSEKNGHPTPKPLKFWKLLTIRGSVFQSDLILDPFLGSGTTAVAAKILV